MSRGNASRPWYTIAMGDVQQAVVALIDVRRWTLAALADRLGVHWHTVRTWYLGEHPPANPVPVLIALRQLRTAPVPKRHRFKRKGTSTR